ncbi:hypothetical protein DUNSADRAFT_16229 [Dunaliella salina]|uniref:Uncharacterized protein n=1 Tax=Dunaliella salina TaxID=3046 RepID=A0ABQ7H132_DUNSA|nr:hypothetical protein DUNSADRAFT_16229 [Dunaliella salina]|eukprot:KAF5840566.1 hypothetical protein DUNSADRAFT_16229 [Dunaliella salina]
MLVEYLQAGGAQHVVVYENALMSCQMPCSLAKFPFHLHLPHLLLLFFLFHIVLHCYFPLLLVVQRLVLCCLRLLP